MQSELIEKARAVRLVVMDVDGVLTDGKAFYGGDGSKGLCFDVHDGAGIRWLQRGGIATAIISGRELEAVRARAEDLGIQEILLGAWMKLPAYEEVLQRTGVQDREVCCVGDDLMDLPLMRRAGLSVAVANARPEVRQAADMVTDASGGNGAVREIVEFILKAQGKWDAVTERYFG